MSDENTSTWDERTLRLHAEAPVVLAYMNPVCYYFPDGLDFAWFVSDDARVQGSLSQLRAGGVDLAVLSIGVEREPTATGGDAGIPTAPTREPVFQGAEQITHMLRILDGLRGTLEAHADAVEIARTVADVERINAAGKLAVLLHLTGAWIDGDLAMLRSFYRLGVRAIHPAIEGLRGVADASDDFAEQGGLAPLGREIVREMNRLGMVVDVSHASDASFWQILETSRAPVIASHSNARARCDRSRNLSDAQVRALAEQGGVVGVHFSGGLIDAGWQQARRDSGMYEARAARSQELRQRYPEPYEFLAHRYRSAKPAAMLPAAPARPEPALAAPRPTLAQLVDHIDHLVKVAGIDHVGIGSDYELGDIVVGLDRAALLPNLTAELLRRGYREEEVRKLWGENSLRVFRQVLGG